MFDSCPKQLIYIWTSSKLRKLQTRNTGNSAGRTKQVYLTAVTPGPRPYIIIPLLDTRHLTYGEPNAISDSTTRLIKASILKDPSKLKSYKSKRKLRRRWARVKVDRLVFSRPIRLHNLRAATRTKNQVYGTTSLNRAMFPFEGARRVRGRTGNYNSRQIEDLLSVLMGGLLRLGIWGKTIDCNLPHTAATLLLLKAPCRVHNPNYVWMPTTGRRKWQMIQTVLTQTPPLRRVTRLRRGGYRTLRLKAILTPIIPALSNKNEKKSFVPLTEQSQLKRIQQVRSISYPKNFHAFDNKQSSLAGEITLASKEGAKNIFFMHESKKRGKKPNPTRTSMRRLAVSGWFRLEDVRHSTKPKPIYTKSTNSQTKYNGGVKYSKRSTIARTKKPIKITTNKPASDTTRWAEKVHKRRRTPWALKRIIRVKHANRYNRSTIFQKVLKRKARRVILNYRSEDTARSRTATKTERREFRQWAYWKYVEPLVKGLYKQKDIKDFKYSNRYRYKSNYHNGEIDPQVKFEQSWTASPTNVRLQLTELPANISNAKQMQYEPMRLRWTDRRSTHTAILRKNAYYSKLRINVRERKRPAVVPTRKLRNRHDTKNLSTLTRPVNVTEGPKTRVQVRPNLKLTQRKLTYGPKTRPTVRGRAQKKEPKRRAKPLKLYRTKFARVKTKRTPWASYQKKRAEAGLAIIKSKKRYIKEKKFQFTKKWPLVLATVTRSTAAGSRSKYKTSGKKEYREPKPNNTAITFPKKQGYEKVDPGVNGNSGIIVSAADDSDDLIDSTTDDNDDLIDSTADDSDDLIDSTADDSDDLIDSTTDDSDDLIDSTTDDSDDLIDSTADDSDDLIDSTADDSDDLIDSTTDDRRSFTKAQPRNSKDPSGGKLENYSDFSLPRKKLRQRNTKRLKRQHALHLNYRHYHKNSPYSSKTPSLGKETLKELEWALAFKKRNRGFIDPQGSRFRIKKKALTPLRHLVALFRQKKHRGRITKYAAQRQETVRNGSDSIKDHMALMEQHKPLPKYLKHLKKTFKTWTRKYNVRGATKAADVKVVQTSAMGAAFNYVKQKRVRSRLAPKTIWPKKRHQTISLLKRRKSPKIKKKILKRKKHKVNYRHKHLPGNHTKSYVRGVKVTNRGQRGKKASKRINRVVSKKPESSKYALLRFMYWTLNHKPSLDKPNQMASTVRKKALTPHNCIYKHITSFRAQMVFRLLNVCSQLPGVGILIRDTESSYGKLGRKGLFLVKKWEMLTALAIMLALKETEQWGVFLAKTIKKLTFKQQRRFLRATFLFFRHWNTYSWAYQHVMGFYFKVQGSIAVRGGMRKRNYIFSYGLVPSNTYTLNYYMHNRLLWNRAGAVGLKTILVAKK